MSDWISQCFPYGMPTLYLGPFGVNFETMRVSADMKYLKTCCKCRNLDDNSYINFNIRPTDAIEMVSDIKTYQYGGSYTFGEAAFGIQLTFFVTPIATVSTDDYNAQNFFNFINGYVDPMLKIYYEVIIHDNLYPKTKYLYSANYDIYTNSNPIRQFWYWITCNKYKSSTDDYYVESKS